MQKARILSFATLITASLTAQLHIQGTDQLTIAFDLGGVLLETNAERCGAKLGEEEMKSYTEQTNKKWHDFWPLLYEVADRIGYANERVGGTSDPAGNPTPGLLCAWMRGTRSCQELIKLIAPAIQNNPQWFTSSLEQLLLYRFVHLIFTPEDFAGIQDIQPLAEQLVRWCKERGHRVVVLSNWCRESFDIMHRTHRNLFDLFDGFIISGHVHFIKPDPAIFQLLIQDRSAHSCIFIDNQQENINNANRLGIHTILCRPKDGEPDLETVAQELAELEQTLQNATPTTAAA